MRFLTLISAIMAALPLMGHAASEDTPPPQTAEQTAPTVTVAKAEVAEVEARVPLSGTLVARKYIQVFPQVAGFEIVALNVEPGDQVTKGQELARLSDATLTAQLAQADAELQRAVAGVSQAESQISSADAALKQAVAAAERARSLRRSGSGTQASLDQAEAAEAAAQSSAASAKDGLAVARATEAQAQAARDLAKLNLDWTKITSPVDGRVTARSAQLGGIPSAAGEPMFTIVADGSVEFEGEVIENALPQLEVGQETQLNVAGVGPVSGKVRQLPAAVDPVTRLGLVRVELPDDDRLLTGLFASGEIVTMRRQSLTVPSTAVLSDDDGERVQVVKGGVVETRPVRGGLVWQDKREILEGLAEGETVITRAGAFFTTGDEVTPLAPSDATKGTPQPSAELPTPDEAAKGTEG